MKMSSATTMKGHCATWLTGRLQVNPEKTAPCPANGSRFLHHVNKKDDHELQSDFLPPKIFFCYLSLHESLTTSHYLGWCFSTKEILPPRGRWQYLETFSIVKTRSWGEGGGGITGVKWAKARDAVSITVRRAALRGDCPAPRSVSRLRNPRGPWKAITDGGNWEPSWILTWGVDL